MDQTQNKKKLRDFSRRIENRAVFGVAGFAVDLYVRTPIRGKLQEAYDIVKTGKDMPPECFSDLEKCLTLYEEVCDELAGYAAVSMDDVEAALSSRGIECPATRQQR